MFYTYNKDNPNLPLFEDESSRMRDSIKTLFDSILEVKATYIHYTLNRYGAKEDSIIEHVERVFAYELYRCWSDNKKNEGYVINAEISKQLYSKPVRKSIKLTYPDMVLHGGQNSSENLIVCEIKRYENVTAHRNAQTKDLNKLGYYLNPNLEVKDNIVNWKEYQFGVYILIGYKVDLNDQDTSMQFIKGHIRKVKFDVPLNRCKRIICLAYNGDCENIYYTTLNQLL